MAIYGARPVPPNTDKRWKLVDATMRKTGGSSRGLIETLHTVQEAFGFLDEEALRYVALCLHVPFSRAYGVATFYHFFTLKPGGRHTCVICLGTACYIKGAPASSRRDAGEPAHRSRRNYGRWRNLAAHGALPWLMRAGAGGGLRPGSCR